MKRRVYALLVGGGGGLALGLGMTYAPTRTLAIVALTLAVAQLAVLAVLLLLALRFWAKIAPQVEPLLTMFAPSATTAQKTAGGDRSGRVSSPPADLPDGKKYQDFERSRRELLTTHAESCGIHDERPCDCAFHR